MLWIFIYKIDGVDIHIQEHEMLSTSLTMYKMKLKQTKYESTRIKQTVNTFGECNFRNIGEQADIDQWDYIRRKHSFTAKETIYRMKRQLSK